MGKPGFGVIGLGTWGENHLRAYAHDERAELVAICDLDADRPARMAAEFDVKTVYTDYQELLGDESVQAVSIVTPDFAHAEIAVDAARAGKDILIEKPMATTVADCERIVAETRAAGVKLMVDFHNRWNPSICKAREAVEAGELGAPSMMYVRLNDTIDVPTDWLSWAGESNVLWFLGSHCVDVVRWLFGDEVVRVHSVSRNVVLKERGIDTPDFYQSILELRNGGVAVVENCWIVAPNAPIVFDFKVELVGSEGTVYVDGSHHRVIEKYSKQGAHYPDVLCGPVIQDNPVGFGFESIRHFIDCVVNDKQPMVTGQDGLAATKVICAMLESASNGKSVEL